MFALCVVSGLVDTASEISQKEDIFIIISG